MSSKKRALLIQPPLEDFYTTPIRLYPLGLLYVARVFEEYGWEVKILDCLSPLRKKILPLPDKFSYLKPYLQQPYFFRHYYRFGLAKEKIFQVIKDFSPDLIGLGCSFAAYYRSVDELAREIKKYFSVPVIVGGNQASCFPEAIKAKTPAIDAVITGQAELSLPRFLIENFGHGNRDHFAERDNSHKKNIKNRAGKDGEARAEGGLDWKKIWPSHHLLEPKFYRMGQKNYASLQASRGCPFGCTFCNVQVVFGSRINYRPIDSLLEEMRFLYEERQTRIFNFEDDNLSWDREWFQNFLAEVKADDKLSGIELLAMNGLNYDTLDEELLVLMKEAGFRKLDLPYVSGQPEIRKKLRRPEKKGSDYFWQVLKTAKKLGYFLTVYLILGLPGQTDEEIEATAEKLWEENVLVAPSIFYLAPGSELHRTLSLPEEIRNDWDMYRSSAFALETPQLSREQLIRLFLFFRQRNLARRAAFFCDGKERNQAVK